MSTHTPLPSRTVRRTPPKKPPGRKIRWGRLIFLFVSLLIIAFGTYAGILYFDSWKPNIDKIAKPVDGEENQLPKEERAQNKPISLLLLGLDTRPETGSMNTDVMMVASFNPETKTATVVSIPRDSDLSIEGYKKHKANGHYSAFYRYGQREKGLEGDASLAYARDETRIMLSEFFDIKIDYTAVIDFQGFVDVVDALGGVNVNVDQNMRYIDNADGTNINLTKGEQELDGEDALGFVRYRHSNSGPNATAESSDFERNDRQNQVLGAIVDRMKSFSTIGKVDGILDAVGNNMRTDIPEKQIENIINTYLINKNPINRASVRFIPLTGNWRSPYVYLDEDKVEEAKEALAEELIPSGRPLEVPASPSASTNDN